MWMTKGSDVLLTKGCEYLGRCCRNAAVCLMIDTGRGKTKVPWAFVKCRTFYPYMEVRLFRIRIYELNTGTSILQIQPLNELYTRAGMVKVHIEVRKSRIYDA